MHTFYCWADVCNFSCTRHGHSICGVTYMFRFRKECFDVVTVLLLLAILAVTRSQIRSKCNPHPLSNVSRGGAVSNHFCNFQKLTVQHSHLLLTMIAQRCGGVKISRVWCFPSSYPFSFVTQLSALLFTSTVHPCATNVHHYPHELTSFSLNNYRHFWLPKWYNMSNVPLRLRLLSDYNIHIWISLFIYFITKKKKGSCHKQTGNRLQEVTLFKQRYFIGKNNYFYSSIQSQCQGPLGEFLNSKSHGRQHIFSTQEKPSIRSEVELCYYCKHEQKTRHDMSIMWTWWV